MEEQRSDLDQHDLPSKSSASSSLSLHERKLVPWLNWDEWIFVYNSLFSDSADIMASALKRITAWRSRGCLPVVVEVTASIIEIHQRDPHFRKSLSVGDPDECRVDQSSNDSLSEEMLAMLYCMAIMRLVNGVIEKTRKKKEVSIAVAADAIGIPRTLIDIRHEGSHRELPALQVVRSASVQALTWLKSYYWEPQKKSIPYQDGETANIKKEIESKLHELVICLKSKDSLEYASSAVKEKRGRHHEWICGRTKLFSLVACKLNSSKSKGHKKELTKILKNLAGLYSSFSSEVVSVLIEFLLNTISSAYVVDPSVDTEVCRSIDTLLNEWNLVITIFTNKEPDLLFTLLKTVLHMIETQDTIEDETGRQHLTSSNYGSKACQVKHLSYLFVWLVRILNGLKLHHHKDSASDIKNPCLETIVSKVILKELLRKCLLLSASGNKHLMDSTVSLCLLIADDHLVKKVQKLSSVASMLDSDDYDTSPRNSKYLRRHDESISQAAEFLEMIQSCRMKSQMKSKTEKTAISDVSDSGRWMLAKSWNPCPIGMLPRAVGSSGCLPNLYCSDGINDKVLEMLPEKENCELDHSIGKRQAITDGHLLDETSTKRKRMTVENCISNDDVTLSEGVDRHLMIEGVWKKVSEEELVAIKSSVRILV